MAFPAPEQQQAQPGVGSAPQSPLQAREQAQKQAIRASVEAMMAAQLPGEGYLYADDPEARQKQLIKTTPQFVRDNILRAIEVLTFDVQLPLSEEPKADAAKAILALSQSYLLLDPLVDAEGVSVEGKAMAQAKASAAFPPRVPSTPAEEKVKEKNEGKSEVLKHDRPQQPRPQPRVGG